ncbi:hypothetical protein [Serinicoccus chungangensis]|uniref:hypothetical protein n=1 Tax=Serinicoccus chungangensis TaxID=767452 RepID=UPI00137AAF58|nr:hypothetical protein [Serinicoccus chungangensis]
MTLPAPTAYLDVVAHPTRCRDRGRRETPRRPSATHPAPHLLGHTPGTAPRTG